MRDKILLFIIGILVGAVITTGAFFIYTKVTSSRINNNPMQMPGGQTSMQGGPGGEMGQPPEKPDDSNMPSNPQGGQPFGQQNSEAKTTQTN